MSQWQSGDTLDSVTLNARMASAATSAGFSTNTLRPESGNTISVVSGTVSLTSTLVFTPANSKIVPGGTSFAIRDNSDSSNNVIVFNNAGARLFKSVVLGEDLYSSITGPPGGAAALEVYGDSANPNGSQWGIYCETKGSIFGDTIVGGAFLAYQSIPIAFQISGIGGLVTMPPNSTAGTLVAIQGELTGNSNGATTVIGLRITNITGSAATNAGIIVTAVSGATTNNYGILIDNVSGTGAFAIKTGTGTVSFGDLLDVSASTIRLRTSGTPTGLGSGNTGDIKWDANYIYVCTSANSWSRATLNRF